MTFAEHEALKEAGHPGGRGHEWLVTTPLSASPLTLDKYPNKPLLLMSIFDLIGSGYFRGHLVTSAGIFLPGESESHPSRGKLAWHRRELFAG